MFLRIPKLLDSGQLDLIARLFAEASFTDGKGTAGDQARKLKNNLQIDRARFRKVAELDGIVVPAIATNAQVRAFALPRKVQPPLYSRYLPGMEYGAHTDNPVMSGREPVRTDLSVTIFLSEPEGYEGGDLVLSSDIGDVKIKLPKGDAVIYPTGTPHAVVPVRSGERAAAITWIQSMVADPFRRQILFDLDRLCGMVRGRADLAEEPRLASKIYGNLVRIWADV